MRNKLIEAFIIIILIQTILLVFSVCRSISADIMQDCSVNIRFPAPEELFGFRYNDVNNRADSITNQYLASNENKSRRRMLSDIGPQQSNKYLTNPVVSGQYALDGFFSSLTKPADSGMIRIAHYGDSQLEGDRITSYLRTYFQNKFGGTGIGFVPFDDIASNASYTRTTSPNWIRYTVFHRRYGTGYYGMSGNVFKFSKYAIKKSPEDTLKSASNDTVKEIKTVIFKKAIINIKFASHIAYANISLMYGRSGSGCTMSLFDEANGNELLSDTIPASDNFCLLPLKLKSKPRNIRFEFSGSVSPDFYGLLVDGEKGVQVDNYAIRGHSGDGMLLINAAYLYHQIKKLNTKLIILQYGANVIPYAGNEKNCERFEKMYYTIFKRFKSASPELSVLVIGPGDMATNINGEYRSYPVIPKVVEAQKNAALKAGCAFWNLYEVMGGLNSINIWVSKGLASHDGHFTHKGQQLIGKELFNTIMTEYNHYIYRQRRGLKTEL